MVPEKHSFTDDRSSLSILCHTFNEDRSEVALAFGNTTFHIYKRDGASWNLIHVLSEHCSRVTALHWATKSNRIVSAGADRNAYVWTFDKDLGWKPVLVLLRINRAATCVRWSPGDNKFAVGSAAKLVSVCYYEPSDDFWVAKQIRRGCRSTVTCVDWHPNNQLIGIGSTDFRVRIYVATISEISEVPTPSVWGGYDKSRFGDLLLEVVSSGWVHSLSFSSIKGDLIAFVSHNSSVNVIIPNTNSNETKCHVETLKTKTLPYKAVLFVNQSMFVVAGYDAIPVLYKLDSKNRLQEVGCLDEQKHEECHKKVSTSSIFKNMADRGTADEFYSTLKTVHQNAIVQICAYKSNKGLVSEISTCGLDGLLVIWNLQKFISC